MRAQVESGSLCESFTHLRYKWLNSVRPSESRPAGRARGPVRHRHRLKLNRHTHGHVASVPIDSQHVTTTHTPTATSFRSTRLTVELSGVLRSVLLSLFLAGAGASGVVLV